MFELDAAIVDWKRSLRSDAEITQSQVEELETHVRDSIEGYTAKGLTDQEAFLVATQMLGDGLALKHEFREVHGSSTLNMSVYWILVGFIGGKAVETAIGGLSRGLTATAARSGVSATLTGLVGVITLVLCWAAVLSLLGRRSSLGNSRSWNGYLSSKWLAVPVLVIALGSALDFASRVGHARVSTATDIGTSMLWLGIGNAAVQICVFTIVLTLLFAIARKNAVPAST